MLKQRNPIDIKNWDVDAEFGIFPQGARAKDAVFSPAFPLEACIVPNKRYLFKRSKRSYPDQFWGEVIAYRIGCALRVDVPPAFAGWNSDTGTCGALIEWFYIDGEEVSILAGDFLTKLEPNFDRIRGSQHNLRTNTKLLRAFSAAKLLPENTWKQWWVNALAFDALIGNTDRHQDNWGILFPARSSQAKKARLTPLFDNGTSLGHERFPDRVASWDEQQLDRYIAKGKHHLAWALEAPPTKGHFVVLQHALQEWPETKPLLSDMVGALSYETLCDSFQDLLYLPLPVALSPERYEFICKLLKKRLFLLQQITQ